MLVHEKAVENLDLILSKYGLDKATEMWVVQMPCSILNLLFKNRHGQKFYVWST